MNEVQLCNLALSLIGNKTITSIQNPQSSEEKICSVWYEITKKDALIKCSPNFARHREYIPVSTVIPAFGFQYCFKKPNDCLKVIGIGNADELQNDYIVEGDYIHTNITDDNALPIRFVKDITDETKFSIPFINYFIVLLARNICYQLNKDQSITSYLEQLKDKRLIEANTEENQESKIKVVYNSRYKEAMRTGTSYRPVVK